MYSKDFCKVYNLFGWNYYPEAFAEQLLLWMKQKQISFDTVMDLGCGTGILCRILQDSGIQASGMDLSEAMIEIARNENPDIPFEVANMITFCPDKSYDLVTCTGDALNHIHDLDSISAVFSNVYQYLNKDGYFIFDILNENEVSEDEPFDLDFSDTIKATFQFSKSREGLIELCVSVYENGEFQFREAIHEKIHDPGIICNMLQEKGFEIVKCSNQIPDEGNYRGTTWYVIAKK